jgi:hypothetical protein
MIALLRQCQGDGWKKEFNGYGGVMYQALQKLMNDVTGKNNFKKRKHR